MVRADVVGEDLENIVQERRERMYIQEIHGTKWENHQTYRIKKKKT